ncbi:alanine racemase [Mesorhizobium sp. M2D.F.Ca.ET.185.01.1.1]|nr:alanine racemase [Mesorhizobium sp. M2D.F.Ca.ET.140.01.1.1]TGP16318.1 alanine racemase [Mesorhizobium sp. M2D.F.Ca.ET.233.01.1.1]TGP36900.1 alanine racemase [Mesorhizobium sp. M2D.F.Ca.ET.232.01.1.1]TGP65134.1 alanine racemase [Mesorhizobium sp. M2D.F.Ca.ET.226.01.1.1]TGP71610.1 alanine racemase [Mesorhizobium sp. M2D.F.Ca.ET.225.01.1.1]TGP74549.1 alanine racemase [Mesorhizobium sp. M2D.F.Ca.ET.224.01.1.1]TGP77334.1 alanine racemase [bacterium M00.F.Ca.ET.227.01.1.1]TGP93128.1 alanine rac
MNGSQSSPSGQGLHSLINQAEMVVDLEAVRENYRRLSAIAGDADCAAVVKGDAYGHGMVACALALWQAGARTFFVATANDGVALRTVLQEATISVLGGFLPEETEAFAGSNLLPVLNSRNQIEEWHKAANRIGRPLDSIIHFDTGMNRLGLLADDTAWLRENLSLLSRIPPLLYMSHLSAADDLDFERCEFQRKAFLKAVSGLPAAKLSLANSAGVYLGENYLFDMVRPGKATFGINPLTGRKNPMLQPASVIAPIIQVNTMKRGSPVGYSSTYRLVEQAKIATVAIGYANGYSRAGSSRATVFVQGFAAQVVGRVSMDLLTVDVSAVPDWALVPGSPVEILGPNVRDHDLAKACGTIEHEVLISLGHGCARRYVNE